MIRFIDMGGTCCNIGFNPSACKACHHVCFLGQHHSPRDLHSPKRSQRYVPKATRRSRSSVSLAGRAADPVWQHNHQDKSKSCKATEDRTQLQTPPRRLLTRVDASPQQALAGSSPATTSCRTAPEPAKDQAKATRWRAAAVPCCMCDTPAKCGTPASTTHVLSRCTGTESHATPTPAAGPLCSR